MNPDLESLYKSMPDDNLIAILHSLSYRSEAQKIARDILLERGVSENIISNWRDPAAEFGFEVWSRRLSTARLRRMATRRKWINRISLCLPFLVWVLWHTLQINLPLFWIWLFHFFFLPLYWRTPTRILFLRPFNARNTKGRTRRFAKRYLRYLGHTYTLSDPEISPRFVLVESPVLAFLKLYSPWFWFFRTSFHVKYDQDIKRLVDFMSRRIARNYAWRFSTDKLFKITCSQNTWKETVRHLINCVQLIVVDLSVANDGLKWELREIMHYDSSHKMIYIAHEDSVDFARETLGSCGLPVSDKRIFVYRSTGRAIEDKGLKDMIVAAASRSATTDTVWDWRDCSQRS